jgi:hypothetical protein
VVRGTCDIYGERVFALEIVQGRDPDWVGRPFFARYDPGAMWLDELQPAFGEREFFFQPAMRRIRKDGRAPAWAHRPLRRRQPVIFGRVEWD